MTASATTIEVHDPEFRSLMTIPLHCVRHVPPAHLDISRFVLCRNYRSADPIHSCAMGTNCKFVHADLTEGQSVLRSHSIHVNYAWRSLESVSYPRLPAGQLLHVLAPNNRQPAEPVLSDRILQTKGSLNHLAAVAANTESPTPLSHCAHYYFNRMCNRGEQCNFIHAVYVDPAAKEFQRAPPRAGGGRRGGAATAAAAAATATATTTANTTPAVTPRKSAATVPVDRSHVSPVASLTKKSAAASLSNSTLGGLTSPSCSGSDAHSNGDSDCDVQSNASIGRAPSVLSDSSAASNAIVYRRNPYSLTYVTLPVSA